MLAASGASEPLRPFLALRRSGQQRGIDMLTDGDDAGRCSNGLTAQKFRDATPEERTIYRKWLRGMVLFYCTLLFLSGVAMVSYFGGGRTELTNLSAPQLASSARAN